MAYSGATLQARQARHRARSSCSPTTPPAVYGDATIARTWALAVRRQRFLLGPSAFSGQSTSSQSTAGTGGLCREPDMSGYTHPARAQIKGDRRRNHGRPSIRRQNLRNSMASESSTESGWAARFSLDKSLFKRLMMRRLALRPRSGPSARQSRPSIFSANTPDLSAIAQTSPRIHLDKPYHLKVAPSSPSLMNFSSAPRGQKERPDPNTPPKVRALQFQGAA